MITHSRGSKFHSRRDNQPPHSPAAHAASPVPGHPEVSAPESVYVCTRPHAGGGVLGAFCVLILHTRVCLRDVSTAAEHLRVCSVTQSCPALCDPMDCSPPGSSDHGILQARILEWVAIPFSRDLPNPEMEPTSLMSPALAGRFFTTAPPGTHTYTSRASLFFCRVCSCIGASFLFYPPSNTGFFAQSSKMQR